MSVHQEAPGECPWDPEIDLGDQVRIEGVGDFGTQFGYHLLVTDIDEDGQEEVLASGPGATLPWWTEPGGFVGVYEPPFTANGYSTDAAWGIVGRNDLDTLGTGFDLIDITWDGRQDLVVGAPYATGEGVERGGLVYFIDRNDLAEGVADELATSVVEGDVEFGWMGEFVVNVGDVSGDGRDDLAAGSFAAGLVDHYEGRMVVFTSLPASGIATEEAAIWIDGSEEQAEFACDFDGMDYDGDGFQDLVVGQERLDFIGGVRVFLGPLDGYLLDVDADVTLTGEGPGNDLAGWRLANAGDTNGDGYEDLLTGAGQHDYGAAYVVRGGGVVADRSLASADIRIVQPTDDFDHRFFGTHVEGLGDLDRDGWPDILVAEANGDPGLARLYLGPLEPPGTWSATDSDVVIHGMEGLSDDYFDVAASAADLTGDGGPDLVLGSHFWGPSYQYLGAVYIVQGSGW